MKDIIKLVSKNLLEPSGLCDHDLHKVMDKLLDKKIDAADIYIQCQRIESWVLDDGIIKEGNYSIEQGAGLRAVVGEKTGFAYTDDLVLQQLNEAADSASKIAKAGRKGREFIASSEDIPKLYPSINPLTSLHENEKLSLMFELDTYARKQDSRVKQVSVSLVSSHEEILILNDDGELVADIRPLVRLSVSVIAEQKGRREQGSSGGGARDSLDFLLNKNRATSYAKEAVRQALLNLEAVDAPAGILPVVLGPGWPGVLLHEAVGHGLEGDFNRKGTSAFSGRMGEKVASSICTIVDDGTIENRRGSLSIDDEGTQSQNTVLIENGILSGYMQDKLNARLMKMPKTGNGRRESYAHLPMPRMTNTYMLPGESDPSEIISSVERGLYAVNFGGGQVDITSGKFVFTANEAYLIEKGKITTPVKGATLTGSGPEAMNKITMVGNDLELDGGVGTCGKEGQSVPVGVGQPTLKLDELTIGGTAK